MNYLQIPEDKLKPTVVSLNILLAEYHVYYQNLRNFHWNILGKNFFDLHEKFEDLYTDARTKIDEIAERILTLQFHPVSKMSDYLKLASINEVPSLIESHEMVERIIENHTRLLEQMKEVLSKAESIGDEGTIDMMGGYIREMEKETWMLNAWSINGQEKLHRAEIHNQPKPNA